MEFCALASGSKANCIYVGGNRGSILVDAGLSWRETKRRLVKRGLNPGSIVAVLITHEHSDHVKGAQMISKTLKVPFYMTSGTSLNISCCIEKVEIIDCMDTFSVGDLTISSFPLSHDAADPVGFRIMKDGYKLGIATDLGRMTREVHSALSGSNWLLIESNYDEGMLNSGPYPEDLKSRIRSPLGHLSNTTSAHAIADLFHSDLAGVWLGHLSESNNNPTLALECARTYLRHKELQYLECLSVSTPSRVVNMFDVVDNIAGFYMEM